jgi:enterochelin esterase-like enzyme
MTLRPIALLFGFLLAVQPAIAVDDYQLGPDSMRQDGVPQGKVTEHDWNTSKVYPGTERKYWVYVPSQYDGSKPACVMVFQDGQGMVSDTGSYRVPIVFDNLIHKKEMPVTIAILINPGVIPPSAPGGMPRRNRSNEYDRVSDDYSKFLIDEILPEVSKSYKLTDDPECRAICGNSSGGICAFTVAWHRPDVFRKVVSHIGSFTNIQGGYVYPSLIRKTEKKPLRVFLQDGSGDLDNMFGNWPLANQEMAAALAYSKYDYKFVYGDGAHNGKHGGSIFPDTMRWLWRDYAK